MAKKSEKKTAKPLPKTKKFGDHNMKKKSCSQTKAAANKIKDAHKAKGKGKLARVVKDPVTKKWCTYTKG